MADTKLYNGDCLELMKQIPDKSVDMILCDLPYGLTQNKDDIRIPFRLLWEQYERIIKDNGCIALFAQGIFYADLVNSNRKLFKYALDGKNRVVRHDGYKWENVGFPLDNSKIFYSLNYKGE